MILRSALPWYCSRCSCFVPPDEPCFDCGTSHGSPRAPLPAAAAVSPPRHLDVRLRLIAPPAPGEIASWTAGTAARLAHDFATAFVAALATDRELAVAGMHAPLALLTDTLAASDAAALRAALLHGRGHPHEASTLLAALMLATTLELSPELLHTVALAALMHDVGIGGLRDDDGPPVYHTRQGEALLRRHAHLWPWLDERVIAAVRHHHDDLSATTNASLFVAKVIAVADRLACLLAEPPHELPHAPQLLHASGLDPGLVQPLLQRLELSA